LSIQSPINDAGRLAALTDTGMLDSPADESLDRITSLVSHVLAVPVALVSLVDRDRQFFKSSIGLSEPLASKRETPLSHSFCKHVVASAAPLIVEDARTHPIVSTNGAVTDLGVVAYLGVPLTTGSGHVLGALCAIDGTTRQWNANDVRVMRDMAEIVMREIALHREIAQRKKAEQQQQLLIAELHHRVKNTLTVVQSLIALSIRHTDSLDAFRESIVGRITSLATTHTLLVEGQWLSISLRALIEGELRAHDEGGRITVDGPEVMLSSRTAVAIGMAMHELITNAVKHGALSIVAGRVALRWSVIPAVDGDRLVLEWTESGGPPVCEPKTRGFGSVLLERVLSSEFNGKITSDYRRSGLHVRMETSLTAEAAK
jgi:two-component sensor histidine kinase